MNTPRAWLGGWWCSFESLHCRRPVSPVPPSRAGGGGPGWDSPGWTGRVGFAWIGLVGPSLTREVSPSYHVQNSTTVYVWMYGCALAGKAWDVGGYDSRTHHSMVCVLYGTGCVLYLYSIVLYSGDGTDSSVPCVRTVTPGCACSCGGHAHPPSNVPLLHRNSKRERKSREERM